MDMEGHTLLICRFELQKVESNDFEFYYNFSYNKSFLLDYEDFFRSRASVFAMYHGQNVEKEKITSMLYAGIIFYYLCGLLKRNMKLD